MPLKPLTPSYVVLALVEKLSCMPDFSVAITMVEPLTETTAPFTPSTLPSSVSCSCWLDATVTVDTVNTGVTVTLFEASKTRELAKLKSKLIDVALLPQGLSNALGNPSVRLAVNDHRVDAPSDVVDGCIACYLDAAGLRIDLAFTHGAPIGEYGIVHLIVRGYA